MFLMVCDIVRSHLGESWGYAPITEAKRKAHVLKHQLLHRMSL